MEGREHLVRRSVSRFSSVISLVGQKIASVSVIDLRTWRIHGRKYTMKSDRDLWESPGMHKTSHSLQRFGPIWTFLRQYNAV